MHKGSVKKEDFDYTETFSPVVKPITIRIVLTLVLTYGWKIHQLDVHNAFLNGKIEEEIFMRQPPGFEHTDRSLVCKLNKALDGLKQAPRAWFHKLTFALEKYGFTYSKCDNSLFICKTKTYAMFVLVYVDDIIVTCNSTQAISALIKALNQEFSLKDLGQLHYFLGVEVKRTTDGGLHLSQTKYIKDFLTKAKMHTAEGVSSPINPGQKLLSYGSCPMAHPHTYRSVVRALQYLTITRPELAFAVHKVCQYMHNPLEEHWKCVKRILRYLSSTVTHGLLLQPSSVSTMTIHAFSDAD